MRFGTWMRLTTRLPASARATFGSASAAAITVLRRRVGRHGDGAAQLAHHLHRDRHGVRRQQVGIGLRPGQLGDQDRCARMQTRCTLPRPDAASSARSAGPASPPPRGAPQPGRARVVRGRSASAMALASSYSRATATLNAKLSSASVTAAIVRWVTRRKAPAASEPNVSGRRARHGHASTSRNTRWVKRYAPATPASVHSMSRSGGLSDRMNQRAVSAP